MQMGPEPKLQPKAETKPMITPGTTATSAASTNALAPRPTLFPGGRHAALLDKLARLAALSPVIANKILTAYDAAIAPLDEDVDALLKIGEKYM
jgi:hypothetical protein